MKFVLRTTVYVKPYTVRRIEFFSFPHFQHSPQMVTTTSSPMLTNARMAPVPMVQLPSPQVIQTQTITHPMIQQSMQVQPQPVMMQATVPQVRFCPLPVADSAANATTACIPGTNTNPDRRESNGHHAHSTSKWSRHSLRLLTNSLLLYLAHQPFKCKQSRTRHAACSDLRLQLDCDDYRATQRERPALPLTELRRASELHRPAD